MYQNKEVKSNFSLTFHWHRLEFRKKCKVRVRQETFDFVKELYFNNIKKDKEIIVECIRIKK